MRKYLLKKENIRAYSGDLLDNDFSMCLFLDAQEISQFVEFEKQ